MLIREITLRNLLSFGPETPPFVLRKLNVLIGPNGSGKSNFIEAIGLLQAAPKDLAEPIREGGGIREWIWKGEAGGGASITTVVGSIAGPDDVRHSLMFSDHGGSLFLKRESVEVLEKDRNARIYDVVNVEGDDEELAQGHESYFNEMIDKRQSILSQLPRQGRIEAQMSGEYWVAPELIGLEEFYKSIRIYRNWCFGRQASVRQLQRSDLKGDSLAENFENLALVLNRLQRNYQVKEQIDGLLNALYPGINGIGLDVLGGLVQLYLGEDRFPIPATRLSDGTLRYLCLLAILCHPKPPPLVCIEEPELGLHPDVLVNLARLLKEASERTQLIITTHSEILVDALTYSPEDVVVCEKVGAGTVMKRLDPDDLSVWLKDYTLGELWSRGQIGGNRW